MLRAASMRAHGLLTRVRSLVRRSRAGRESVALGVSPGSGNIERCVPHVTQVEYYVVWGSRERWQVMSRSAGDDASGASSSPGVPIPSEVEIAGRSVSGAEKVSGEGSEGPQAEAERGEVEAAQSSSGSSRRRDEGG